MNWRVEAIDVKAAPGLDELSRLLQSGSRDLGAAAPMVRDLDLEIGPGPAWTDEQLGNELEAAHRRFGASDASLDSLRELRAGRAGCVITGQQPGLLGGPLFCAYKIAGAAALARALTAKTGKSVVPVYWCGADDSDFEEARRMWVWGAKHAAFRVEMPQAWWSPGQRVGSIDGARVDGLENVALSHAEASLPSPGGSLDFGERMQAFHLRLFAADGLVVIDARSARLRSLGHDLFARYVRDHEKLTAALLHRREQLKERGEPVPIAANSLRSALFILRGEHRKKLDSHELSRLSASAVSDLAASVVLRPVWQDALLSPAASILGPTELAYHAQLAPLYEGLGVTACRPAPRPHVTVWPRQLPWSMDPSVQARLLAGGTFTGEALGDMAIPSSWTESLSDARKRIDAALVELASALESAEAERTVRTARERLDQELDRLRRDLKAPAVNARIGAAEVWRWAPDWIAVRGTPQERALAASTGWQRWGEGFPSLLRAIGDGYLRGLLDGPSTSMVAFEGAADD